MRAVHNLFKRMREARQRKAAAKAGRDLNKRRVASEEARKADTHSRLCVELGRAPNAWRGR